MGLNDLIPKDEVLTHIEECLNEIAEESSDAKTKYQTEVSISNRMYYQGVHVGTQHAANKLIKLRDLLQTY